MTTTEKGRFYFNIIIGIGSLILLIMANGFRLVTILVWFVLISIYVIFIANKWYDFMDGVRDKILPSTTDSFENPDYNYCKKKDSH